jgi:hypothetical protein
LFEVAGNVPKEREKVLSAIEELRREGLVEGRGGDFYALTERGKQAASFQPDADTTPAK